MKTYLNPIYNHHRRINEKFNAKPLPFYYEVIATSSEEPINSASFVIYSIDLFSYKNIRTISYKDGYRSDIKNMLLMYDINRKFTIDGHSEIPKIEIEDKNIIERISEIVWKAVNAYTHLNSQFAINAFDVLAAYMRLLTDKDEKIISKLLNYAPFNYNTNRSAKKQIKSFIVRPPSFDVKRIKMYSSDGTEKEFDPSIVINSFSYSGVLHFEPRYQDEENSKYTPQIGKMVGSGLEEEEVGNILRWVWAEHLHLLVNIINIIQRTYNNENWHNDMLYLKFAYTSSSVKFEPYYFNQIPGRI